ncbi:MAG TPA: CsgG/HfaB family protein [Rectinemataceae bacterium]|nr:CsgG/HfaB family protein [Rectinemataceae bacterium]
MGSKRRVHCSGWAYAGTRLAALLLAGLNVFTASAQAVPAPVRQTLSILYFDNLARVSDFDWLRAGLSDMLTTDIAASGAVTVVEREQLATVLKEQELQLSGVVQESDAVRMGMILAATRIVYGSFVVSDGKMSIDARLVDTESAAVLGAVRAEGPAGDVLLLERKIASGLMGALGVASPSAPSSGGASVVQAAAAYYAGLAALDSGSYQDAASHFREASDLDPSYGKPQLGLEAAYRFLKDFRRGQQQKELAALASSVQRLRSRVEGKFYTMTDMATHPKDFGYADVQAAVAAMSADSMGYAGSTPAQAIGFMENLLLEMGLKAREYFGDQTFAAGCAVEIGAWAARALRDYPQDSLLAESQYPPIVQLRLDRRWPELKAACETFMARWPDFRMIDSVEDAYQESLDRLSGKD